MKNRNKQINRKIQTIIAIVALLLIIFGQLQNVYAAGQVTRVATTEASTLDQIMTNADKFISKAEKVGMSQENMQNISLSLWNILLPLSVIIAVIIGIILGIQFIFGGVEGKAQVMQTLIPYVVGCIVVFASFTIWKIVVDILQVI